MQKRYQVAVLAVLFSTLLACSVERTANGPSAPSPIGSLVGSGDHHETSWACATRTASAEPSFTTGEWTIQRENCVIGTPAILSQSAPAAASEPIFAPGPTNFRSTVNGSIVLLQWDQGAGASGWQIEAGSGAGLANLAVLRLGPVVTFPGGTMSYTVTGVPNGVYFVRVRSTRVDFSDVSVPSNEIIVAVGTACTSAPNAPESFSSSVVGNTVNLQWAPPTAGPAPTSYLLEVGAAPGLSDILVFDTGNAGTTLQAFAPARIYFVRLRSRNACGTSANVVATVVVVGGTSTTTISGSSSTTTTIPGGSTTTASSTTTTTVGGSSSSTTSPSTAPTTTSTPVAPTASFTFTPSPCTISGSGATENCTFDAAGSNAGSGTITAYIWNYLGNSVQTSGATLVPTFGGCGIGGGQQVSIPVTLQVRNSFNLTSAPFNMNVTVRKVNACGFGQ